MDKQLVFAAGLLLTQAGFAAGLPPKNERNRELSEIVFQNYPARALAAGEQGAVFFTVELDKAGRPMSCEVFHGSGHPLLDEETCNLIVQHAVFSSARDASGRAIKEKAEGVVNWTIPGHEPVPVTPVLVEAKGKPEKQFCKKSVRTGTLAAVERTCMTAAEWARQSDETKQIYREMQGKGFSVNEVSR